MPKRIPISAATKLAEELGLRQVILVAWDGEQTHVVTYGKTTEDCDQAAQGGDVIKKAIHWPDSLLNTFPSRVKALKAKVAELEAKIASQGGT
jgi:uncharacterized Rossmann fold enzyme